MAGMAVRTAVAQVGGAFGDLGTFLPHVIAAITVVGMSPSGVLVSFGLFYLAAGALYGIPMPVQPMKAAPAAVLVEAMAPAEVAGAALVIGTFFLLAGASGFITQLTRKVPAPLSDLALGLHLPSFALRGWSEIRRGAELAAIPQIP